MRFGVSRVLDAIEARLTTDPLLARAVLDLAEVVRLVDLDRDTGKPATLLRLGHVIDALGRHVGEGGAAVYVVAPRGLLSDLDLTSNERMVVRRWADDGQVEVLAEPGDRVAEVAGMLAVPVISRRAPAAFAGEHPWLPGATLVPTPAGLTAPPGGARAPASPAAVWLTRLWRCPEFDCAGFAAPAGGQPPPRVRSGAPTCPRHETRLADVGPRPAARVLAVRVDGTVQARFVVREGAPVAVGRSPGEGVSLGQWLDEEALRWISRSHLRLDLRGSALVVTDTSTNGTVAHTRGGSMRLPTGQGYGMGADDVLELHEGVELAAPGRFGGQSAEVGSVMAEAPTVAMRLPGPR